MKGKEPNFSPCAWFLRLTERHEGQEATLGSLRGKLYDGNGISLMATYHPACLLRSLMDKAKAWQDAPGG